MFTGVYSGYEGWNRTKTTETREEIIDWFEDVGIDVDNPNTDPENWWNPSPMIISGNDHSIEQFIGFQY